MCLLITTNQKTLFLVLLVAYLATIHAQPLIPDHPSKSLITPDNNVIDNTYHDVQNIGSSKNIPGGSYQDLFLKNYIDWIKNFNSSGDYPFPPMDYIDLPPDTTPPVTPIPPFRGAIPPPTVPPPPFIVAPLPPEPIPPSTVPPPLRIAPPPLSVVPPPQSIAPPPLSVLPPSQNTAPPPLNVVPPPLSILPPSEDVPPNNVVPPTTDIPPITTVPPVTSIPPPTINIGNTTKGVTVTGKVWCSKTGAPCYECAPLNGARVILEYKTEKISSAIVANDANFNLKVVNVNGILGALADISQMKVRVLLPVAGCPASQSVKEEVLEGNPQIRSVAENGTVLELEVKVFHRVPAKK